MATSGTVAAGQLSDPKLAGQLLGDRARRNALKRQQLVGSGPAAFDRKGSIKNILYLLYNCKEIELSSVIKKKWSGK